MSLPKIYAYNLDPVKEIQIKGICNAYGFIMINVPYEHQNLVISSLVSCDVHNCSGNCFTDEMMLLVGFDGKPLDTLTDQMRDQNIAPVKYKAVLTEFNSKLTSYQLHGQLRREAEAIKEKMSKND